ncbi:MAG: hypothetical protein KUL79_00110 [Thauera sp.]|nr:hypothetical protein [Thauera sp.]
MALLATPLADLFTLRESMPQFDPDRSALVRGYMGTWQIDEGKLWLVALEGKLKDGTGSNLTTLFPDSSGPVLARWFSGTLRIPQGELLEYVHSGFKSIYERDLLLQINNGCVVSERIRHNTRADGSTRPWLDDVD